MIVRCVFQKKDAQAKKPRSPSLHTTPNSNSNVLEKYSYERMMKSLSLIAALVFCSAFPLEIDALEKAEQFVDDGADCASAPDQDQAPDPEANDELQLPIWWNYSRDDLYEKLFNCGEILHKITHGPVTEKDIEKLQQQFNEMREKYKQEVNLLPIHQPTPENSFSMLTIPTEIKDAGRKGRGLFATEKVNKGSLIGSLNAGNVGIFKDGATWRSFAATLPRETACNLIEWNWVQEITPEKGDEDIREGLSIFITFDESNLMNSALIVEDEDEEEANIRCGSPFHSEHDSTNMNEEGHSHESNQERWGPCRFDYYATRDIEAGEELLIDYNDFEDDDQHQWIEMGL